MTRRPYYVLFTQKLVIAVEDLTRPRSNLLWLARKAKRESDKIEGCWSHDGQILVKNGQNKVMTIFSEQDLKNIIGT